MKTLFYERTAYHLSQEPVPNCFFMLDEYFDNLFATIQEAYTHSSVLLAEMICGRMADIELYAFLVDDARNRNEPHLQSDNSRADIARLTHEQDSESMKGAILLRTYWIGYLAACKSLLDTAACALTELYELPLELSDQKLEGSEFWHKLVLVAPNVHRRYHSRRLFYNEIIKWADEIVHRLPPIALLEGHLMRQSTRLEVITQPTPDLHGMITDPHSLGWRNPLELHRSWKPNLLDLCERLCQDIERKTADVWNEHR